MLGEGQAPRSGLQGPAAGTGVYAALDLGTNNCRLLIARRAGEGFRVIDAFSRIVRLGEGLAATGAGSPMARKYGPVRLMPPRRENASMAAK